MEPAQDALRREMFEETGLHAAVGRLIWVIENFFDWEGTPLHEVGLYFEMSLHKHATVFEGKEGEKTLEFRWFGFDELPVLNVQPRVIAARLSNLPSSAEYIVHDGRFER